MFRSIICLYEFWYSIYVFSSFKVIAAETSNQIFLLEYPSMYIDEGWTRRVWVYQTRLAHVIWSQCSINSTSKFSRLFSFNFPPDPILTKVVAHLLKVQSYLFFVIMPTHDHTQRSIRNLLFHLALLLQIQHQEFPE